MNYIFKLLSSAVLPLTAIALLSGCTAEEPVSSPEVYTYKLNLNIARPPLEKASRATSGWTRGDVIYLTFDSSVPGKAEYNGSSWNVSTETRLSGSGKLTAVFIENEQSATSNIVNLDYRSAVYEATDGKFSVSENSVSATATLTPRTGRVRFSGNDGDIIRVYGIDCPVSYSPKQNTFTTRHDFIELTVTDGYTPYIHGLPANEDAPLINVVNGDCSFTRSLYGKLTPGAGGYFAVPTEDSHFGWDNTFYFYRNNVRFNFIPVSGFGDMYLMADTELTQNQARVFNANASASDRPWTPNLSDCVPAIIEIVETAKLLTGLDFFIPTSEQWLYAAREGKYNSGYVYSGSDNIDDVAWYKANASYSQNVAQKQPNRLGFYDMTGNISEAVYKDGNIAFIGGDYTGSPTACRLDNSLSNTGYYYNAGLRLCIKTRKANQ